MKIDDECTKKVDCLFDDDLASYLKENGIFCLKYLKASKIKEYLIEKEILYKDAINILEIYELNKDRLSPNLCHICENKNKIEYYQTSLFNLGSVELSNDYVASGSLDYFNYLEKLVFEKALEQINVLNDDLDLLKLCPRILYNYFKEANYQKVSDLRKMSYLDYELVPEYLLMKFNKFLDFLRQDVVHMLEEEFIKLITNEEERKLILLNERIRGLSLNDTGLILNLSKEWVRILELQIVNDFEHFIIKRDYKLYRLVKLDDEVDEALVEKYFGKYSAIFNYLYLKTKE